MTNLKTGEGLLEAFEKHLQEYPPLQAAYIEAIHRFYFDTCFSPYSDRPYDTEERKAIFNLLRTLSCEYPEWRYTLSKAIERYKGGEPVNALYIGCKPKRIVNLKITHKIIEPCVKSSNWYCLMIRVKSWAFQGKRTITILVSSVAKWTQKTMTTPNSQSSEKRWKKRD